MKRRYLLAPEAARDLASIWKYLKAEGGEAVADRVVSVIRNKLVFLAEYPGAGHTRSDLTDAEVRFFAVYAFLIVYRSSTTPLQVVSILHGRRDVSSILGQRL